MEIPPTITTTMISTNGNTSCMYAVERVQLYWWVYTAKELEIGGASFNTEYTAPSTAAPHRRPIIARHVLLVAAMNPLHS
jgi:hypothetical protein